METVRPKGRVARPDVMPLLRGLEEADRLARGGHSFVGDHVSSRHACARVVRSDVANGRLLNVEKEAALNAEGVLAVLTAQDIDAGGTPGIPLRFADARCEKFRQPVIAGDRVRYVGEPVAIVVAEDAYLAEDAADLVEVDVDPLPARTDARNANEGSEDRGDGSGTFAEVTAQTGDVHEAFRQAHLVLSGEYVVQRQTGLPIEPRGLIAEWSTDGDLPFLHLWGVTKHVFLNRRVVAGFFGIMPEQVIVHSVDVGGMFGVRGEFYPEDYLVPWAARVVERPVAWLEDRREHMMATNHSRQQIHQYELAVAEDGKFLAYRDAAVIDAGAYARPIGTRQVQVLVECLPGPYRWEALEARVQSVATNKTPVGQMRAPQGTEATFVRERAIDRAAARLGLDPVEIRQRNLISHDDLPYRIELGGSDPKTIVFDSGDYYSSLEALLARLEIQSLRSEIARRRAAGEWVGLGLGLFVEVSGSGSPRETVRAELNHDGMLLVSTGACDVGQGLSAMVVGVAHEQLGIGSAHVRVLTGDSRAGTESGGTFGSRTAIFVGNAVADAMKSVRAEATSRAAAILEVETRDIHIETDGLKAGDRFLHWKEVAPIDVIGEAVANPTWGFGAHAALVHIDKETLNVAVERLEVAYDCGRALDRTSVEGQLRGGMIYGLGGALYEECSYDEHGQPLSTTLMEYLLPTYGEVPELAILVLESEPADGNTLGIRGAGEAGVVGVGAAVANAVANALPDGEAVARLPLTPDLLYDLIDGSSGPAAAISESPVVRQ